MANLFSLCNQIEQFLQDNDQPTIDRLIRWLEVRLKWKEEKTSGHDPSSSQGKSLINTSQIFLCPCGHRYSLRFSMADLLASTDESISADSTRSTTTEEKVLSPIVSACKRVKTTIAENHSSKLLICTHCQIRLHTRETFLQHYSMHQQGYSFCKRCFQFYLIANGQNQMHDCERGKSVSTNNETVRQTKCDELHSLEQLIPPDTLEQPESNAIEHGNEHDAVSAARLTRFGLPILTDSIVEMTLPDGKRQFRCPLCLNSYVNRSGLNRHYITHSSQDLWKVECQFCGKRYSRKDSLKHHMKTQHAQMIWSDPIWNEKHHSFYHPSNDPLSDSNHPLSIDPLEIDEDDMESSSSSTSKQRLDSDEIVLIA